MPRTINFLGSVALLVSSITGPSLVVIPLLFQQAGWLTPLLTFTAIALLSGAAALLVVEAMSSIEGNEKFQASIEFTTIAHLFLGKRWHLVVQALSYLAMQTLVVASLLESFQSMDAFLITVAHKTCAVSFSDGGICVSQIPPNGNSAFSSYILGSFGTLITMCLVLPLSLVGLVDNIIFQVASFIILLLVTFIWIIIFAITGFDTQRVPAVGHDQSTVVGFVLSNFAFVTTVPAWVNNTHPAVNIRLAVWLSVFISCLIYIPIGWMGGLALVIPDSSTLLQVFATDMGHGTLAKVARVSSYLFPLAVLITSIPVFAIVIRYNLLRGNLCSNKMAIFLSAIVPWLIAIPFQTNDGVTMILNWASLIFTSPANLLIPFILYIVSRRHTASAVLDANISLHPSPATALGVALTPLTMTPVPAVTPPENIPVVIITDSTDTTPDNWDESKTLPREPADSRLSRVDVIPVPIKNRVLSPSKFRYYGQEVMVDPESSTSDSAMDRPVLLLDTTDGSQEHQPRRRPSLSISLSPSHSITHSGNTGMDEFLLMSPTSPEAQSRPLSVRSVFGPLSPRPSMAGLRSPDPTPHSAPSVPNGHCHRPPDIDTARPADVRLSVLLPTLEIDDSVSVFRAFPCIPARSPVQSTHISVVGCLLAAVLVLIAIVYNIISSTQ